MAGRPVANRIVDALVDDPGLELFRTPAGVGHVDLVMRDRETFALADGEFQQHLVRACLDLDVVPSTTLVSQVVMALDALAAVGAEHEVFARVAAVDGGVVIDLGDRDRRAVEITASGWEVVSRPSVRFVRKPGMLALLEPTRGASLADLHGLLGVPSEADFALVVGFLLCCFRGQGPYPVLVVRGEQGSGKSRLARVLRGLVDPTTAPLRALPGSTRDLAIAAAGSLMLCFDNLSRLDGESSDALCRLTSGGGFATRRLYTDGEEVVFDACRPVVLTAIGNIITAADLADRALTLTLPALQAGARRTEADLEHSFEPLRGGILGLLLDGVAGALKAEADPPPGGLPRLADAALWADAGLSALGLRPGAFVCAHAEAHSEDAADLIAASPIGAHLEAICERGFEGAARDLLRLLNERASDEERRSRDWPPNAGSLVGHMRRLAPALRETAGIDWRDVGIDQRHRVRIYRLRSATAQAPRPTPVPPGRAPSRAGVR